ncbi:MAG: histidine ammonia-lyase [Cryomorphaceae bacterium]|nr:histidine ammonia-lyase [Flavobacteriales bacterium]
MIHTITDKHLSIERVGEIVRSNAKIECSPEARERIEKCRTYLDEKIENADAPIYGINTGFGSLHHKTIGRDSLELLQRNLVTSHACGTGKPIDSELVKIMLLLKIQGLSYGHSGVTIDTVERLMWMFNNDVLPVVYEQGSLGASGDLAPLAHLALPLIGLGEVWVSGEVKNAADVLNSFGLEPLSLRSKEGLAMLNGTQFMSALGICAALKTKKLLQMADLIGVVSLEAFDGRPEPFKAKVHEVRKHPGQIAVAAHVWSLIKDSKSMFAEKKHVQDPYSFRCIPQVHGASRDAFDHFERVFENEINAVTDNPTVFPDSDEVISAGNFHGQPLAINLDYLAIAVAELGSISERRTYKLVNGERNLPDFLVANPGLNSGFMIPQYTAASMVSRNKQRCTPSSVDTIDSSNGQEDHVSMGANGAVKLLDVLDQVETILGIELLNGCQALDFRDVSQTGSVVQRVHRHFREVVEFASEDRELYPLIASAKKFVANYDYKENG